MTQHQNYRVVFTSPDKTHALARTECGALTLGEAWFDPKSGGLLRSRVSDAVNQQTREDLTRLIQRLEDYGTCVPQEGWLSLYPADAIWAWDDEHETYALAEDLAGPPKGQEVAG